MKTAIKLVGQILINESGITSFNKQQNKSI